MIRPRSQNFVRGIIAFLLIIGGLAFFPATQSQAAKSADPPGPDRIATIKVDATLYTWWMAYWKNNKTVCSIEIDHEGQPTLGDVYSNCDQTVYDTWSTQKPCINSAPTACEGYYVYLVDTKPTKKELTVKLPPAVVWLSLENCDAVSRAGTNICESTPVLVLQGQEPLPNEHITRIEGTMDNIPFTCDATCKLQLAPTKPNGVNLRFWAWSSYGDSSEVFTAQVRVANADAGNPDQASFYVDVLSSQWQGVKIASCAATWNVFPPVGGPPPWLSTPKDPSELTSDIPYNYLSANLILQGAVDASGCPDGGILPDGGANQCGQETARGAVDQWQNQFDSLIINTADKTGVPAQLLKNLFARESQFWPGVFKASTDAGLGQLTNNGADATLLWNPSFFNQYCPLVLSEQACSKGYLNLKPANQELLRQALVSSVNASCANCPLGIDLSQANFSVGVFAHTLLASCEQTAQVIQNNTGQLPGAVASYEDLWKFTLVDYNAGAGCLGLAVNATWTSEQKLTWDAMSTHFTDVCAPAKDYVNDISK